MKKSIKILKLSDELYELITKLAEPYVHPPARVNLPHVVIEPHRPIHVPELHRLEQLRQYERQYGVKPSEPHKPSAAPGERPIRIKGLKAKFPEGFNLEKAPELKIGLEQGLRLEIDKKTNTYAIDPQTKALKIEKIPSDWIKDGKITPEAKNKIKAIKKELALTAKEIKLTEKAQRKALQSFRRGVKWELFKQKLPARAAAGAAVLTGVAGLYFAFSGKSTVPNATPEQSKFISQVLNTPSIASIPPAQPTIISINKLISDLNKIKSGKTSEKTIQFINSNVSALQNLTKALEPMSSLQSPDPGSITSYRKDAMTLKMQINTFNSMVEELKSKLESSNQIALVSEVEDIQSTLYTYNNLIDQAMQ